MEGTVKWFSKEKGYGFIASESGIDHYFNVQGVNGASLPSIGDKVTFDSKSGDKGPRAFNISITSKAAAEVTKNSDDRVSCPSCGKKIVPRMITYRGQPQKSVCPYCATTVKEFSSNCYIATAVYGDPFCYQVMVLRSYRDERLLSNKLGRLFVKVYYKTSPKIATWLSGQPLLSRKIKSVLDRIVRNLAN